MSDIKKTFILDTSVLLYDKESIKSFPGANVIIPMVVLDELDRFKDKSGLLGESARYVNRFLDDLREIGSLHSGVELKDTGQTIRVELNNANRVPKDLNPYTGDNKIISVALALSENDKNITVITKDINFRVKCDSLKIKSEDYYKDKIVSDRSSLYSGQVHLSFDNTELIKKFYDKKLLVSDLPDNFEYFQNQFIIGKSQNQSFLGVIKGEKCEYVSCFLNDIIPINPRNKEQKFALDILTRKDVPLVTLTGIAGSGKTFLTLLAALSGLHDNRYERIVVTRSLQPVGREIGFLPGGIRDKMDPWIAPIIDNFRHAFKDISYFDMMRDKGQIEVAPLSFIRGRTFNNAFVIVDEAQNATIHELKTIITRVGENSKIALLGDVEQIDTPYIDTLSNGLTVIIEKFKKETLSGHISLIKGERSELATLASKVV